MPNASIGSTVTDLKFIQVGRELRCAHLDDLSDAEKKYGRKLDFAGYLQGKDLQYIGVIRGNYYAKPFGNDSSNVQAIMGTMGYWNRVYYRSPPEKFKADKDGYDQIKKAIEPLVKTVDKPQISVNKGEGINFFNTLADHKYGRIVGGTNRVFNYDKQGHRSSPTEVKQIISNYFRRDRDLVVHVNNKES
jgi:hypothetical protein